MQMSVMAYITLNLKIYQKVRSNCNQNDLFYSENKKYGTEF